MNRVIVNIQGVEYTLKGDESEEYLTAIGFTVNKMIDTMLKSNKKLNTSSSAILTACNLMDENMKLEKQVEAFSEKETEFAAEKSRLTADISKLEAALLDKTAEIETLKALETDALKKKEEDNKKLAAEIKLLQESVREYRDDNEKFSKVNKELKFELQSYKYKVLDLQNKLFENQMNIAKDKKVANGKTKAGEGE